MKSIFEYLNKDIKNIIDSGDIFNYQPYDYLKYLNTILDKYNFSEDFNYLLNIFPIVSYLLYTPRITKKDKREMIELLKEIREKIQILILRKPGNIQKDNPNFTLLKNIINNIESLMIINFYDFINYNGSSIELMEYLLFELRDYELITEILNQYPYMIRLRNGDVSLFQKVLSNYIKEIYEYTKDKELGTNFNLIYYDKITTLFLLHPKLEFSFKEKMDAISHINYCRKSMNPDGFNQTTKRKFVFWLNHLEEKLNGNVGENTIEEICYMYDIKMGFDESILSEAKRLNHEIKPTRYHNRTVIDNEYIITIDGNNAQELDDGLSIQKMEDNCYKLGVHIADPTGLIQENSIILDEAFDRSSSIYLKEPLHMFPPVLAKDKMNLLANKYRLATSYYLYIDSTGEIINYEILETVIKVSKNTTYDDVNRVISSGTDNDLNYFNTVILLKEITDKLKGNFKIDKTYALINRTTSNPTNTNITENTSATKIVEICMMMVNHIVPYHMYKNNLPCIYRIHTIDSQYLERLSSISKAITSCNNKRDLENMINYLKATYPKSKYSTEAKEHFGLGIKPYTHLTAPLRRYLDNAMKLYVLDPFYFNHVSDSEAYLIEEKQKRIIEHINEQNIIIDSFMDSYSKLRVKLLTKP